MSSKSRMSERRRKQKWFERSKEKLKSGPFRTEKFVISPDGEVKLSEVLREFVEPYRKFTDTKEKYQTLLRLGVIAWNTSFFPEKEQQGTIQRVIDKEMPTGTEEMKNELKEILHTLIVRKKAHFSEYKRKIIDFDLIDRGKKYHLTVTSSL
jgi:hypothetical protein